MKSLLNWLANSHGKWQHRSLTSLILSTFDGKPQRDALSIVLAIPWALFLCLLLVSVGQTITVIKLESRAKALERAENQRPLTKDEAFAADKSELADIKSDRDKLEKIVIAMTCFAGLLFANASRIYFRQMVSLYLWTNLEKYMSRLFAMATKQEVRELALLELNVSNAASLNAFLVKLLELAQRYEFPFEGIFYKWKAQYDREQAALAAP